MKKILTVAVVATLALALMSAKRVLADTHGGAATTQPTLDQLLNIAPSQHKAKSQKPAATNRSRRSSEQRLEQSIKRSMTQQPASVFGQAIDEMAQVSKQLRSAQAVDAQVRRTQKQILAKLDQVIAAAKRQQGGSSSSSTQKSEKQQTGQSKLGRQSQGHGTPRNPEHSTKPAGRGAAGRGGHGPAVADEPLAGKGSAWGGLPPRLRDELSNGLQERYSPLYQTMTADYYKKLAQIAGKKDTGGHE